VTRSKNATAKFFVSAVVVVILSTQAVAGFVNTGKWGWPILPYPMYHSAHFEGDRLDHEFSVFAILSDGRRVPIKQSDMNMNFHLFRFNVVQPIEAADVDALGPVIDKYCELHDDQVVKLQVEDQGVAIGRDGPVEGLPPEILGMLDVSCQ